jgi:HD-GYP domain-containing protein (c-di-GMP phosphodiesterase class II)
VTRVTVDLDFPVPPAIESERRIPRVEDEMRAPSPHDGALIVCIVTSVPARVVPMEPEGFAYRCGVRSMLTPTTQREPVLEALAEAIAAYHRETRTHCGRVAGYAMRIGELLSLDTRSLTILRWAGTLHDLGKVAIPKSILEKTGRLDTAEWELIKRHSIVGSQVLLAVSPDFAEIATAVRSHHERWDGGGYPDGLSGSAIPLFGRIVCIADVFDSITRPRPYRATALRAADALAYLRAGAGRHFDPDIIAAVLSVRPLG